MSYTHVIMRKSGRAYIRTPQLDAKADAIPAIWDHEAGKAVPYTGQAIPEVAAEPQPAEMVSTPTSELREELEKLTKAEIADLALAKFDTVIGHGNKAEMIDAFVKLAAL